MRRLEVQVVAAGSCDGGSAVPFLPTAFRLAVIYVSLLSCRVSRGGALTALPLLFCLEAAIARGRKPKKQPQPDQAAPELLASEQFADYMSETSPEMQARIKGALEDRACGFRFWAGDEKRPGSLECGARRYKVFRTDLDTGEQEEGWIYEIPPNERALQLLIEQRAGRPPVRETRHQDMVVNLIHRVPGKRDFIVKDTEPGDEPLPEDAIEIGGEIMGIGAILRDEPEDDGDISPSVP